MGTSVTTPTGTEQECYGRSLLFGDRSWGMDRSRDQRGRETPLPIPCDVGKRYDLVWYTPVQTTSASPSAATEPKIRKLEDLYQFRDYTEVASFLGHNSFLVDLLLEAYQHVQECFTANTQLALEVFVDPESTGQSELFALILTDFPPSDALDSLHRLDEEWWLDAARESHCLLNFDVEFI